MGEEEGENCEIRKGNDAKRAPRMRVERKKRQEMKNKKPEENRKKRR